MTLFNTFLKQRKNRQAKKTRQQRRLSIEQVEDRRLMAADMYLGLNSTGEIHIEGSDYDDAVQVGVVDDIVQVTITAGNASTVRHEFARSDVDRIVFTGGAGNDSFVNDTDIRSIATGGAGNDTLFGGSRADTFFGGGGDDWIVGRGGADELRGGKGHDAIDGGDGKDNAFGGGGDDWIMGGGGADYIQGGSGYDWIQGQDGDDYILGGSGDDIVLGGEGNDVVSGETGNDYVDGGVGDDFVYGGDQMDVVMGGLGVDEVRGGHAADTFLADEYDQLVGFSNEDERIDVATTDVVFLNLDQFAIAPRTWATRGLSWNSTSAFFPEVLRNNFRPSFTVSNYLVHEG